MNKCKTCIYYDEWFDYVDVAGELSSIQYCCTFFEDEKCRHNCKYYKSIYNLKKIKEYINFI